MSTEDQSRTAELRVGGWVPPYRQSAAGPVPLPESFLASASAAVPEPGDPSGPPGSGRRTHRALIVACAALAVLAVTGLVTYQSNHTTRPGPPRFVALPVVPTVPVPPLGAPSASSSVGPAERSLAAKPLGSSSAPASSSTPAPGRATAHPSASARASQPAARPQPTRTRAPERRGPFTLGHAVGLEPAGLAGYRVRHRDFRARVDRIGAASPSLDRADSTFTVRAGLAGTGCVSFESVNYPGSFLRHRDAGIWLDRRDGTTGYAADATFCPQAGRRADTVVLSSQNHPDRFLSLRRGRLGLGGWPVAFTVRPPL